MVITHKFTLVVQRSVADSDLAMSGFSMQCSVAEPPHNSRIVDLGKARRTPAPSISQALRDLKR